MIDPKDLAERIERIDGVHDKREFKATLREMLEGMQDVGRGFLRIAAAAKVIRDKEYYMDTDSIVKKLWRYCNILRDDGLSYQDYLEQLTFLLFLKMADEREALVGNEQAAQLRAAHPQSSGNKRPRGGGSA